MKIGGKPCNVTTIRENTLECKPTVDSKWVGSEETYEIQVNEHLVPLSLNNCWIFRSLSYSSQMLIHVFQDKKKKKKKKR